MSENWLSATAAPVLFGDAVAIHALPPHASISVVAPGESPKEVAPTVQHPVGDQHATPVSSPASAAPLTLTVAHAAPVHSSMSAGPSVRMPYVILACCAFAMALITLFVHLPDLIEKRSEDSVAAGGGAWGFRNLRFGAGAIFCYVGAEVAIGSIMISFLGQPSMGGMSHSAAARYVSLYWGGAMVGRFIGFVALQKIRQERALLFVAAVAAVLIGTALVTHGSVAMWAVVCCGLFNSVMWPCIFPLSVKGLGKFTSQGSGILIMMVVGGAVIPEIQGLLADAFGYQKSFVVVLLCYAYLVFFAVSGHRTGRDVVAA